MIEVPLVDVAAAHAEVAAEVAAGFTRVLSSAAFIGGEEVAAFEREYAAYCGVEHCVGVANGTDALELALRAVGAGPGREVIIPANTFVATAEAVAATGARPVLVDCDPDTYLIDVAAALAAVTVTTVAVVPVHLYGQLAPVERLRAELAGSGVFVVEDAAQCHGATRHGRAAGATAGTTGPGVAATSFYPGKNLGAYGDAGAVTTTDAGIAAAVRSIANHGGHAKYAHDRIGRNSRLDALQAAALRAKLRRLDAWNARRRAIAERYHELLRPLGVKPPSTLDGGEHVWHLYVIEIPDGARPGRRDGVLTSLRAAGVAAGVHYPAPVHLTPAFSHLGHGRGAFPNAEAAAGRILSLPIYPQLTEEAGRTVALALAAALATA